MRLAMLAAIHMRHTRTMSRASIWALLPLREFFKTANATSEVDLHLQEVGDASRESLLQELNSMVIIQDLDSVCDMCCNTIAHVNVLLLVFMATELRRRRGAS